MKFTYSSRECFETGDRYDIVFQSSDSDDEVEVAAATESTP